MDGEVITQKQIADSTIRAASLATLSRPPDAAFNQFVAELRDILFTWQHSMRGELFSDQENKWVKIPNQKAKCSEMAIQEIQAHVMVIVNKNTFISNLDETQVVGLTCDAMTVINDLMFDKGETWELAPEDRLSILNQVGNMIEMALRRAKDAGEREYYSNTQRVIFTEGAMPGKKGGWNIPLIGGFLGGNK